MVTFTPMSEEDYAAFMRKSIPEYAYDQTRAGNWLASEAAGLARAEFEQMLPQGPSTPNAHLNTILDEEGQKIGMIWYYIDPTRTRSTAFLIDFFLFSAARRKGYEPQVMAKFEEEARGLGVQRVELQVFWHRAEDVQFYLQHAYKETSVLLAKDLL